MSNAAELKVELQETNHHVTYVIDGLCGEVSELRKDVATTNHRSSIEAVDRPVGCG
jgi:hypothetical protein